MAHRIADNDKLWPDGIIPYVIDETQFPGGTSERDEIMRAIDHWNANTNVSLVPRVSQSNYISFDRRHTVCQSYVGVKGGRQSIGCAVGAGFGDESLIHEIGHAAGLYHEHQRDDRNGHVHVFMDRVPEDFRQANMYRKGDRGMDIGTYDYHSIMHYGRGAYATTWLWPVSWHGHRAQGADVAAAALSGAGATDLVFLHIDNPAGGNTGYLRVLRNVQADGSDLGGMSARQTIPGWFGDTNRGAGLTMAAIGGTGVDAVVVHMDDPSGENTGYLRIGWNVDSQGVAQGGWTVPTPIPGWFGAASNGIAVAAADISGSGRPDLVVVHIDNPSGGNRGYYRIGWDVDASGAVSSWSDPVSIPDWWGDRNQDCGVALVDLDGDGQLEMIVMHVDNPEGGNTPFVRIGWGLDASGGMQRWDPPTAIPGWVGDRTDGAGMTAADLDGTGQPDLIVHHIDDRDEDNRGYFRIGPNVDASGAVTGTWTDPLLLHNEGMLATLGNSVLSAGDINAINAMYPRDTGVVEVTLPIPGWFGDHTSGAGIALTDLTGNGLLDVVVFHIDNPDGPNSGYLRVGQDLRAIGAAERWRGPNLAAIWLGHSSAGGGVAVADINGIGTTDVVVAHVDNPSGGNSIYFQVGNNLDADAVVQGGWSARQSVPGWVGAQTDGLGIAIADLGGAGQLDLVVLHVDDPSGGNTAYYRVGFGLGITGTISSWGPVHAIPGWVGDRTQGAGVAIADITGNGQLDMIFSWVDDPSGGNKAYYRIGRALDASGVPTGGWSREIEVTGWVGHEASGAGIAVGDIAGTGAPQLFLYHIDNPSGGNTGYLRLVSFAPLG